MNIDELMTNIGNVNFDSMTQQEMLDYYQELLDANGELQVRLTDLQETNPKPSQEEFDNVKANMETINSEIERVSDAIQKNAEVQDVEEDFTETNDAAIVEKSSIKRNLDRINEVNNRINERTNELYDEQNPYVEMDSEIINLNGEITSLNNEINIARNEVYAYALNYRKANLENNLKSANDRYNARGEELSENGVDYTSQFMDPEYNSISNEINSIQSEINNLDGYTEMYSETRLGNLEKQLAEAQASLASVNANLDERINALAEEGNNYPQIDEEVISLNGQMTALNEQIITINNSIQTMKEEIIANAYYLRSQELENNLVDANKKIEEKEIELDNNNVSYDDRYMDQEYINVCRERDYIQKMIDDLRYKYDNNLLTEEIFSEISLPDLPKKKNENTKSNENDNTQTNQNESVQSNEDENINNDAKDNSNEIENQIKDLEEKLKACAERMQKAREEGNEQAYAEERSRYSYLTEEINKLKNPTKQQTNTTGGENGSDGTDSSDDSNNGNSEENDNDKDMDEEELNLDENDKDEINDNEKTDEEKKKARKQKIKKAAIGVLGGAIGFGLSFALQPGTAGTVISVGRLVYSTAKKGLKVYTEKHKDDENNRIIKMVGKVKEFTKEQAEKHPKITSAISKVNNFLKKPETQVFLNGMATGYTIGKISQAVYKMHEASAMEKKVPTNPEVDKTEPEMMKDVPDIDGTPAPNPNPTPVVTDPTPTFDPTKPVDLSSLGEGYVSSYSSDPVSLITSAGKNAMFDKINVVDGKTWVHFTQGNGAGYAWFPADEVLNALDLSDISELTGEVSGGMHL